MNIARAILPAWGLRRMAGMGGRERPQVAMSWTGTDSGGRPAEPRPEKPVREESQAADVGECGGGGGRACKLMSFWKTSNGRKYKSTKRENPFSRAAPTGLVVGSRPGAACFGSFWLVRRILHRGGGAARVCLPANRRTGRPLIGCSREASRCFRFLRRSTGRPPLIATLSPREGAN